MVLKSKKIERKWSKRGGLRREDRDGRKLQQSGLSTKDAGGKVEDFEGKGETPMRGESKKGTK